MPSVVFSAWTLCIRETDYWLCLRGEQCEGISPLHGHSINRGQHPKRSTREEDWLRNKWLFFRSVVKVDEVNKQINKVALQNRNGVADNWKQSPESGCRNEFAERVEQNNIVNASPVRSDEQTKRTVGRMMSSPEKEADLIELWDDKSCRIALGQVFEWVCISFRKMMHR